MEPPKGFWASVWNFIRFLPYFFGLLILGLVKGIIFCPFICLIITFGNSAVIVGLWFAHSIWTYYSIARQGKTSWTCSEACAMYMHFGGTGFMAICWNYRKLYRWSRIWSSSPLMATFNAVGEGKTNVFFHCFIDGTWSTIQGSFTVVRDFMDVCFFSYFSVMDDLRLKEPPNGKPYEIRLLHLLGAIIVGALGVAVDLVVITCVAVYKSPYMLFKGWRRLFHDLIGREGPFLETICVPFAGLAILLWPAAVIGAVLGSILSSVPLGAFAGVVAYQESSVFLGLSYIITSLAIYDEYSNDVLDMPDWSCFPRLKYRKNSPPVRTSSRGSSFSRPDSFRGPPSRSVSLKNTYIDLKPLELLSCLFSEYRQQGEILVSEGLIETQDFEISKSNKDGSRVISVGLPAYCILQLLMRSIKANSEGLLLSDNSTELTTTNRIKDAVFDWFISPLLVIKDQIKAQNLSDEEENYLCKLVLLNGNSERLKKFDLEYQPDTERKRAELDALARRLRGITRSISRYPTFKRRFDALIRSLSEELAKKNSGSQSNNGSKAVSKSRSMLIRLLSERSFKSRTSNQNNSNRGEIEIDDSKDVDNV
ncbi:hypothetical protein Scep_018028 [Stephania cephalantha]|uniref:Uncharacterized protein n=1 Tax=Stephania cephalantha TaxID=152367 RepID=A0AAP0NW67_9MAGN